MGEALKNPPLFEALCEFRFDVEQPWDWVIPGQLYERLKEDFDKQGQVDQVRLQVKGDAGAALAQISQRPERVRFASKDGSTVVQVGPQLLVVNQLQPYSCWEDFRSEILRVLTEYKKVTGESEVVRVGLRYINRISLDSGEHKLDDFVTTLPPLAGPLSRPVRGFVQRFELTYQNPPGVLLYLVGTQSAEDGRFLMLDLDYVSNPGSFDDSKPIADWLDQAHEHIYHAFIESLQPNVYKSFQ